MANNQTKRTTRIDQSTLDDIIRRQERVLNYAFRSAVNAKYMLERIACFAKQYPLLGQPLQRAVQEAYERTVNGVINTLYGTDDRFESYA